MTPDIQDVLNDILQTMNLRAEGMGGDCGCDCDMEEGDEESMCDECWAEKKAKTESGEKFKKLAASLKARGAEDPEALAAWIGRKKMGKAKFQSLAAAGRKAAQK